MAICPYRTEKGYCKLDPETGNFSRRKIDPPHECPYDWSNSERILCEVLRMRDVSDINNAIYQRPIIFSLEGHSLNA